MHDKKGVRLIQDKRTLIMANQIHDFIKAMQEIKVICQRAESFGVEKNDIDEIHKIIKQLRI